MKTEITNIRKASMGGVVFDFKGGNIRKTQDFITYPIADGDTKIFFQSDKRWMEYDLRTKKLRLSKKGNTSWLFSYYGSIDIEIEESEMNNLLDKIRDLSHNGNGFIKVDNSD